MSLGEREAASQKLLNEDNPDLQKKEARKKYTSSIKAEPEEHHYLLEQEKHILQDLNVQDDSHSEDEAENERERKITEILNRNTLKEAAADKMVVGTGFFMDVTEFFEFKRKELSSGQDVDIFQSISGSRTAWVILIYTVATGALIPAWILGIDANKNLRISWRFLLQMITVIPFMLYEYRTGSECVRQKYSLKYIFKRDNFVKPLISSLSTCLWFTMILGAFSWTSHAIVLGSLSNFFLSLGRSYNKVNHQLQLGGQVLVIGGLALFIYDSITFNTKNEYYDFDKLMFERRTWWERVTFDFVAFSVSFMTAQFSKYTSDLNKHYPPFLSMFIIQNLNWIIMSFSAYFVNGCQWSYDLFWGFFSIFSTKHFANFMLMGIMLSLGQVVSLSLISQLFPDPIIPGLALTLDPFIVSLIVSIIGIQSLPGAVSLVGYIVMIPGLCLILIGQCLYKRIVAKGKENDIRSSQLMKELKELRARRQSRQKRRKEREQLRRQAINLVEVQILQRVRSE